ncbi:hypothetical protein BT96DRAFT_1016411 [Gymnopus androsaceus JB14]|uniref:3-beta hydroxysteroid dehydrogenase/isomerase domain-containing protein n=1 Tax=Gymnopus androsaceus JB14 TaxID=1447944 RepID=A0A6A4I5P0_9AGAR|nr:hypothetical protein BT96DRAFT_1016411 [Gymnopus androsaceus JB14]
MDALPTPLFHPSGTPLDLLDGLLHIPCYLLLVHPGYLDPTSVPKKILRAARGQKVAQLAKGFEAYDKFTVVDIPDLTSSDLCQELKGIEVMIHTAAVLPSYRGEMDAVEKFSTEGTEKILDSARLAGVRNVVVTGSHATYNANGPLGPRDWQSITFDHAREAENKTGFGA